MDLLVAIALGFLFGGLRRKGGGGGAGGGGGGGAPEPIPPSKLPPTPPPAPPIPPRPPEEVEPPEPPDENPRVTPVPPEAPEAKPETVPPAYVPPGGWAPYLTGWSVSTAKSLLGDRSRLPDGSSIILTEPGTGAQVKFRAETGAQHGDPKLRRAVTAWKKR